MKKYFLYILNFITISCFSQSNLANFKDSKSQQQISFTENKGQVHDQLNNARPDILFSGNSGELIFHLSANGISHQLVRFPKNKNEEVNIYRVDVNWIDANKNPTLISGKKSNGVSNYYLEHCPNGIHNVQSYESVSYKDIYPGIDAMWYGNKGELKYDYNVAPGANYKQIKMVIKGATRLTINEKGKLIIVTPFGNIIQDAPTAFQAGRILECRFVLHNNQLSFEVENYNPALSLIIDPPIRLWGTYFGGPTKDEGNFCTTDASGNVYLSGTTNLISSGTAIATTGSHQQSIGGGMYDAFLAKFNASGIRLWSTFLGGIGNDYGNTCTTDLFGNVFLGGQSYTSGGSAIATLGSHQFAYGGNLDAFLVKFNSSGIRQWGTYYGGSNGEDGNSCCTDATGNVYLVGETSSSEVNSIATVGSFQSSPNFIDAFIVKFNSSGVRQWGTYYGGFNSDTGLGCACDASGNVCIVGVTSSSGTNVASPGSYQQTYGGGGSDGFLAKFSSSGAQLWATYYGGTSGDDIFSCSFDLSGNIFVVGQTTSTNNLAIADPGSHQPTLGGNTDAFLAKFNSSGAKQWSTYYGGTGDENGLCCITDPFGNVYFSGTTDTGTGTTIATVGSQQPTLNGINDAFLAKFSATGARQWGTYYGGSLDEKGNSCAIDPFGSIYLGCYTGSSSTTSIATLGSHQPAFGGVVDAFLVKFDDCNSAPSQPLSITGPTLVCAGISATYTTPFVYGVNSYTLAIPGGVTVTAGTNTISVIPVSSGIFTLTTGNTCGVAPEQTINIIVNPSPTVSVNNGTICSGQSFSILASGANSYTYSGGSVVSPVITNSYSVTGTNTLGCYNTAICTVVVNALPMVLVNSGIICANKSFTILPSGASSYNYSTGPVISPSITSSYTVTGTNTLGCTNTAAGTVTVNQLPTINASTSSTLLCVGESATLTASGALTYTFNPGGISSTIIISPTITSNYTITGTDVKNCSNSSIFTQNVDPCASVKENGIVNFDIKLYPNPSKGIINLVLDSDNEVVITNILGQIIFKENLMSGQHNITIPHESTGIYFMILTSQSNKTIIKLIIE